MMRGLVIALLLELVAVSHAEAGWNQWTSMGPGGNVVALAIDPVMPATIYAARLSLGAGVFKSTDGGAHWSAINTGITAPFITALALDVQTPTTVYAGTSGIDVWGVFKSTDGGAHWSVSNAGLPPALNNTSSAVSVLVVDPQTPATLYAGTNVGVFKSTDGGSFWNASNTGLTDLFVTALTVDPQTPATLYVATLAGVFKSTDRGAHWTISDTGLPHLFFGSQPQPSIASLTVDPHDPTTAYAGTVSGVFKSTDSGATWSFSMAGAHFIGSHVSAVVVDPQTAGTLYAATFGAGVYKSTDGGQSWTPFNAGLTDLALTTLQVSPSGACLHAAGLSGVSDFVTQPDSCAALVNPFVSVNEPSFSVGQTLVTSVGLMNLGGPGTADIYLGLLIPDGNTIAFFTSAAGIAFGTLDDLASFRPVATGVPLAAAFAATVPNFFSYQLTGDEPRGDYLFMFLVVQADALADGTLSDDEVLGAAYAPFSFP
jgi:photosystem II stability/assembly factor-like uncharacterized protein